LIIVSFGLKIALVPFHVWVPDIFEGAPKPVSALIGAAPKLAGVAIALRVFDIVVMPSGIPFLTLFAIMAALSMTIANLLGLRQTNILRLLAYSSIAHMGNIMLGLVSGTEMGINGVYLYSWIYLFMNLGAFAIVINLSKALESDEISAYGGLSKRAPALAALMAFFLISLMGIPPTAGFIAKYYVFQAAYQSGWVWLVLLAALNSVISAAYYFKIIHQMYFVDSTSNEPIRLATSERVALAATSFFTIALGVVPQCFVAAAQALNFLPKP
jgi:NADH-quinone oxidoreductase subunit N